VNTCRAEGLARVERVVREHADGVSRRHRRGDGEYCQAPAGGEPRQPPVEGGPVLLRSRGSVAVGLPPPGLISPLDLGGLVA
jgi:hypothetical protein